MFWTSDSQERIGGMKVCSNVYKLRKRSRWFGWLSSLLKHSLLPIPFTSLGMASKTFPQWVSTFFPQTATLIVLSPVTNGHVSFYCTWCIVFLRLDNMEHLHINTHAETHKEKKKTKENKRKEDKRKENKREKEPKQMSTANSEL